MTPVSFSCACGQVRGSAKVPNSLLPLSYSLCHCNVCRHQTGLLCGSYVTLVKGTSDFKVEGSYTPYYSSDLVTRYFCKNCGANVWLDDKREDGPDICSGAFDNVDGIVKLKNHIFIEDTKDGGLSKWIPDEDITAWSAFSRDSTRIRIADRARTTVAKNEDAKLSAHCRCNGVQFRITRPNEASKALSAPWPDLLKPYHSQAPQNKEEVKWWLRSDDARYLAGLCACKSCRLASGFDIQAWAFVPKANIFQLDGKPLDFTMGTLEYYESAPGVYRNFCGRCGATVFWHCHERPDLVDVSVGLLDAPEGARAESWLEWQTGRISFEEAAQNEDLIARLGKGLGRWGNEQHTSALKTLNPLRPTTEP